ncbi:hypothetical protein B6U98_01890 [Thermoplasmatales archaeon ex4572_165]|nr:MAG: hypothetical protein B6U98_01890 [Thermoplasmatales archaeon ex4572_165]RLF59314.1 MAG: hypothetical protein DRN27_03030 [Thermoplasmata archaeon]
MHVKSKIMLTYENEKTAKNIQQALKIDDGIFVKSIIQNNELHAVIENRSISSFLQTIDDYLSCVSVAENIVNSNSKNIGDEKKS